MVRRTQKDNTALDYAIKLKLDDLVKILKASGAKQACQLKCIKCEP